MAVGVAGTVLVFGPWNTGTQFVSGGAVLCLAAASSYAVTYVYLARFFATPAGAR